MSSLTWSPNRDGQELSLSTGHTVARSADPDVLELRAPDGRVELVIRVTERGPVIEASATALRATTDRLELRAATVDIDASAHVSIRAPRVDIDAEQGSMIASADLVLRGGLVRIN